MLDPVIINNITDTYVNERVPNQNYANSKSMYVGTVSGDTRYVYMYFRIPFPRGVTILSAKLHVFNTALWSGSVTLTGKPLSQQWYLNRATWNVKPGVLGTNHQLPLTSPAANSDLALDIKTTMQNVSAGAKWFGFRLDASGSASKAIYSAQANTALRPYVEIAWSDAPDAPEELNPSDGLAIGIQYPTFQCDFVDVAGDVDMAGMNVQISTTSAIAAGGATMTNQEWDSGDVGITVPELITDPADPARPAGLPAWAGISNGQTKWWRVRVKDGAGVWSAWSDPDSFVRTNKGTLTLNNPAVSPSNFVTEGTPPILWTYTGATQKHYQVILKDSASKWLWTTGKLTGTVTTVTLPSKFQQGGGLRTDRSYFIEIRVWDTVNRQSIANETIYSSVVRDFTTKFGTSVTATGLTATTMDPYPWMKLAWSRATAPDKFEIYRGNKLIRSSIPDDLSVGGTNYEFVDRLPTPYVQSTWKVVPVVNGVSDKETTVTGTPKSLAPFLSNDTGTGGIFIMNPTPELNLGVTEEVIEFVSDAPPILVTSATRGFEGRLSGVLVDIPGTTLTARDQRNRFRDMLDSPGKTWLLTMWDESFECFIFECDYQPQKDVEGVYYAISFSFIQTDY